MTPMRLPTLDAGVRLAGKIDDALLKDFLDQLAAASRRPGPIVLELTTTGGDADIGRRLALEIRLLRSQGRELFFLGKSTIYSAGITLMAAFPAANRYVTADASLLIHERRLEKDVKLTGALRAGLAVLKDLVAQLEHGQELERDGFAELIQGTSLSMETLMARVLDANWYLRAHEALKLGLVAGIV